MAIEDSNMKFCLESVKIEASNILLGKIILD